MSGEREDRTTQVDLGGILRILGENLYSTPTVAIRELVQNAHDSCVRRRLEEGAADFEPRIVVTARPAERVLEIEDNGAGLTGEEVVRYLATIGSGYTRELRESVRDESSLIGQFGIGFLSAFVVSERVDVHTTSYQEPGSGHRFVAKGGERYALEPAPSRAVGTRIRLHLRPTSAALSQPESVEALLVKYCALLSTPIHLGSASGAPVNRPGPPWREPPVEGEVAARRNLAFAARYEHEFEPICAIEVAGEEDGSPTHGLVWVQDGATYGTSDNRNVSAFVRGMLVSADARDLLPSWAGFCGAVVEADDLSPTASREDLKKDAVYERVRRTVHESLVDGLRRVATRSPATWRRVLVRHNEALLGASLCDGRLFELLREDLKVPTSEGDLTLAAVIARSQGRIHVSLGERGGYEEIVFRATGIPVVIGTRYAVVPFCHRYAEASGAKLVQLGTGAGDRELFEPVELEASELAELRELLGGDGLEVVPARFEPGYLPLLLVPDREAELKRRLESEEADQRIGAALLSLARQYTASIDGSVAARLYVNLSSPVVERWLAAEPERRRLGAGVLKSLATMMATRGDSAWEGDLSESLEAFSQALLGLLER